MNRRRFVSGAVCGPLGMPRVAPAQSAGRVPRIGWLGGGAGRSSAEMLRSTQFKAFADGLREHGLVVGHSVLVDLRMIAPDKVEQYAEVATRLAAEVDVILAANPFSLAAATQATKTVPIVGVDMESDPVRQGWAATLARPGANVSGFFLDMPEMSGKHVEFLRVVKPGVARVAVLGDPRVNALQFEATDAAARDAGLPLHQLVVQSPGDVEPAIADAAQRRAGALVVLTSPLINSAVPRIVRATLKHRLPSICAFAPLFAEAGGLLAYGPDFHELYRRAATYAARILKGTGVGDLPMQRPEKFLLVINLKTARALALTVPPTLLHRSDQVIE